MVERALTGLAGLARRRRRTLVAVWVALLAAGGWFSLHQSAHLSGGGWDVPGSASVRASTLIDRFHLRTPVFTVFVTGRSPAAVDGRLREVRRLTAGEPHVLLEPVRRLERGRAAFLPLGWSGPSEATITEATRLRRLLVQTTPRTTTRVVGTAAMWSNFEEVAKRQLARGEIFGFPLILLILLAAFGTAVAALAPIAVGFASVFLTGAVVYGLSRVLSMSIYVTNMASMIGIGVAVDYSLFVVSRFRRELRAGASPEAALRVALASSGAAVVFSGVTVAVSLAALFAIDVNALRSMALGAIVVVCVSVLAAVTLLPALLTTAGGRVERWRLRLPWRTGETGDELWVRWTLLVMARPAFSLGAAAAAMLVLASPLVAIRTLNRGITQLPPTSEVREATARAWHIAGPGFASPVYVVSSTAPDRGRLAAVPDVARVAPPLRSPDGRLTLTLVTLASDPEAFAAQTAYHRLAAAAGPRAVVGGATAYNVDVQNAIFGGLWKMLLFILAVSYCVLFTFLRSALLPLKAVLVNLLSVGAAYGVLVAVFQWGWLDWTGYRSPGYVDSIVPALVLAVTFGLSMDYEVFLLTRIRERWLVHGDNERAVAEGLVGSARIITSAAAVMVAVFASFALSGAPSIKELGVGLAVAIFLDASLVRLVIVPATMRLLGQWNWWTPRLSSARPSPARAPAP